MRKISNLAWVAAIFSGILQVLIFPSPAMYFLSWVALAPLLVFLMGGIFQRTQLFDAAADSSSLTVKKGFLMGYLCGVIWYAGSCYWIYHVMHSYGPLPSPLAAGILVLFCLYLGLYHGIFGALLARIFLRNGVRRALLAAPFLWVAIELARARITGFPWDLLGTSQVDNIPLTRLATVTGVYGISWVIAMVNAGFAAIFLLSPEKRRSLAIAAMVAALALQAGILAHPSPQPFSREAILVQGNISIQENQQWSADSLDRTIADMAQLSQPPESSPLLRSSRLIIWPESPAPFYEVDPRFRHWLIALAKDSNATVIAGMVGLRSHQTPGKNSYESFNSAAMVTPDGGFLARYDKIHLVPFGEYVPYKLVFRFAQKLTREVGDFSPGSERTLFKLAGPGFNGEKAGLFICYESIFPDEIRLFVLNGAQVLINISNDGWFGETGASAQHLNMARMRAIENGRWILRSTNTGITASLDPYGQVVARAPRNVRASLPAPYDFVSGTTFYTRHGDWFAFVCAIISVLALIPSLEFSVPARPLRVSETA